MEKEYKTLKEFYPYYLMEHQDVTCRALHFTGTLLLLILLIYCLTFQQWQYLWGIPVLGYGFAWLGHFVFEKNRPATFKYPFYSLLSDFIMFYHIATFQIGGELDRARKIMNK